MLVQNVLRCLRLAVVFAFLAGLAVAQPQLTIVRWVDAGNGTDVPGSGSAAQPYNTVNYALDQVWDMLQQSTSPPVKNPVEIRLAATSQTIAPVGFGGFESYGWMTAAEQAQGCNRGPFPIRMIDRVSIVGDGAQALITIDEVGAGSGYNGWTTGSCGTTTDQALVLGASNCRLENVRIDGTKMLNTAPPNDWPGILVTTATRFDIVDCYVHGWHDQLTLDPGTVGAYCQVNAISSVFADAWPLSAFGGAPANSGHAAIRVEEPGDSDLYIDSCRIAGSHDAIEVEGSPGLNSVVVVNSLFVDNENGFECGGSGNVYMEAVDCVFRDNVNRGSAAGGVNNPTGAVAARGSANVQCRVRGCLFENNTIAAYWWMTNPLAVLDMGTDSDPGDNSFCLDYSLYPTASNPYRVCVWQRSSGVGNTILAAGNSWLPFNQGATGNGPVGQKGRYLRIGPVQAIANDPPPGPSVGCLDPSGQQYPRNYTISNAGTSIDFGTILPVLTPPSCFCCGGTCP